MNGPCRLIADRLVAVTGATGFVGNAVLRRLRDEGRSIRGVARNGEFGVGEINATTDWSAALSSVDVVIHTAARVHVMDNRSAGPLAAFREVNVEGTRRLAERAAAAGVRRLVFVSSVKVHGEGSIGGPFTAFDEPAPADAYGASKWEAELALREVAARTGLDVVVVRPPLVYGSGAKGNFARLVGLVRRDLPLPLGAVDNRRSLVGLDNLVDLLIRCVDHPAAAGQTFLVSDGEDLSTPDLIRRLARAMGRPARLIPVPVELLRFGGRLLGRADEVERLVGSLQVDIRHTCETLDWTPAVSVEEGLRRVVSGG